MADFITHMLVKCFYEYHDKKEKSVALFAYFPHKMFLGFVKIWVCPWECVTHVNVIRHVCHGGRMLRTAGLDYMASNNGMVNK
jgi:hypothetical protein